MKFEVDSKELKRVVNYLSATVNVNSPNVGMRHIRVNKLEEDTIEFKAFDDHSNASYFMKVKNLSGDITSYFSAKTFFNLAKSFNGEVEVSINKRVQIKCNKSKYSISTLDNEVFEATNVAQIEYYGLDFPNPIDLNKFKSILMSLRHCLSEDDSRLELQHVYFKNTENGVIAIACDGVRGSVVSCSDEYKVLDGIFLYKDLVDSIMSIDNSELLYIMESDDKIFIKTDNFISVSTLTDIEYPFDTLYEIYSKSFGEGKSFNISIDPEVTKDAISRLLYLTDPTTNSIETKFDNDTIMFAVNENNSGSEEVPIVANLGEELTDKDLFIDGKKLKEALSKTYGEVHWKAENAEEVQFICDTDCTQFFFALSE